MKRQIKVTPNYSKRTFTIRSIYYGQKLNKIYKISTDKFRTIPFNKDEFQELTYNTDKDWIKFLSCPWYSQTYYLVR